MPIVSATASCHLHDGRPSRSCAPFFFFFFFFFTFPFFFFIFHSFSSTLFLSLQPSPPSPLFSLFTQFSYQIPQFYFIFFMFWTLTTLIFHNFPIFPPHSPNFTSQTLTLTFVALKIDHFKVFSGHSIVGFHLPTPQAPFYTPLCHHPLPLSLSTNSTFF